ncbi:CDP-diacylglycerol--serine O-phosphatidyltransferase [Klebsiella pneumoniae]|nr:CDP-diacylglycerol--serine O-phosphatidyltransferase [Klebsiella pneumoniae]
MAEKEFCRPFMTPNASVRKLDVRVLVDWHRAQRGRIGAAASNTNADWYCRMANENPGVDIPRLRRAD